MTSRLVCYKCGADVLWLDFRGTPSPRCPYHPEQRMWRGLSGDEEAPEPEPEPEPDQQGELFRE